MLTRHSSAFQIMSRNWSTAKCRRRKSSDTRDYIVISATLFVNFSLKSKATNVFPKYILKSKACDKSIQARKKLFCHVIIKNYLCNVLCKFLIKFESTWRREIKEQALQLTLLYCGRTVRSSHRRFCIKKAVLKAVLYKKLALFKNVTGLKACNYIKRRPQHRCFPVNITTFLRLSISKNIWELLLFDCFERFTITWA